MPRAPRPCLDCSTLTRSTRCTRCQRAWDSKRNATRTHYHGGWEAESKRRREAWVAEHGMMCPGIGRPPHPATALELDHTTNQVCCHQCNVNAGPAGH